MVQGLAISTHGDKATVTLNGEVKLFRVTEEEAYAYSQSLFTQLIESGAI